MLALLSESGEFQEPDGVRALGYRLFAAGFPTCCETHARYTFMVIWDIGQDREMSFKMGLN